MVVQVIVAVEQTRDDAARLIVAREVEKVQRSARLQRPKHVCERRAFLVGRQVVKHER